MVKENKMNNPIVMFTPVCQDRKQKINGEKVFLQFIDPSIRKVGYFRVPAIFFAKYAYEYNLEQWEEFIGKSLR